MALLEKIPVVIIHIKYKEYLKINLEITGINNKIYLIGDDSLNHLGKLNNVSFIDINKYRNLPLIKKCRDSFVNYSSNAKDYEWLCFERVFIMKFFMEEFNLEYIFHSDSDNILLHDVNNYKFEKNVAYCLPKNYHNNRMSSSIHSGLLNQNFCNKFIELYFNLYIDKSKFYLIENKIKYHKDKNGKYINGGICDMSLYYIIANENIVDVENLLAPKNNIVFINNINNGEGYESKEQYRLKNNIIDITYESDKCSIYDKINNKQLQIFNIHYQGGAKKYMTEDLKKIVPKIKNQTQ